MFHLSYLLKYFFNNLIKCQNIQLTAIRSFHPSFTPPRPPCIRLHHVHKVYNSHSFQTPLVLPHFRIRFCQQQGNFQSLSVKHMLEIWDILVLNGVGIVPCCYLLAEV